ncbi:MAG: heavy metal translocating P-type ATPase, partial [Desulfobacterales bacterium]
LAGNQGILVRDFTAFEQARTINAVVFDKTGTLTQGAWSLRHVIPLATFDRKQVLSLAAALEKDSEHYIGTEIRRYANKRGVSLAALKEIQVYQNGITGILDADTVKIGSKHFVDGDINAFSFPQIAAGENEALQSKVYMSYAGLPCAVFVFGDTLRTTAIPAVEKLHNWGFDLALISGDGEKTTRAVGKMLGIQNAHGGKLPQDKAIFVRDLQKKGKHVMMVGDGINDAPALVQANLAVAIYSGSHLGKEAADITLMQGDPGKIIEYLNLAKQVNAKIHQNFFLSLLYNSVSIPIAMSGLLTPIVAVCAMLLSSLSVTGNTLLLKHKFMKNKADDRL